MTVLSIIAICAIILVNVLAFGLVLAAFFMEGSEQLIVRIEGLIEASEKLRRQKEKVLFSSKGLVKVCPSCISFPCSCLNKD